MSYAPPDAMSKGLADVRTCPVLEAHYRSRLKMQVVTSFSASVHGDDSSSKLL